MKTTTLHFYFDYLSPFAYFAWRRIGTLCEKYELELKAHPVVFGKLLDHWGQLGPAEIAPKRQWVARYCQRYASLNGFNYDPPKFHPFNPLAALRMSLPDVSGSNQFRVIQSLFDAGWTEGEDLGDANNLIAVLRRAEVDCESYVEKIAEPRIKQALITETSSAIEKGVFGIPTIIVKDQLFWGNDQFQHIELLLEGKDPIQNEKLKKIESRARGIDRKIITGIKGSDS